MENEKCPVCGKSLMHSNTACTVCSFRCGDSDLPRIAAAMKLVKLHVEFENCSPEDEYKYQDAVEWARMHVIEVFGGE